MEAVTNTRLRMKRTCLYTINFVLAYGLALSGTKVFAVTLIRLRIVICTVANWFETKDEACQKRRMVDDLAWLKVIQQI